MPHDWPDAWRRVDSRWGPMVVNRHDAYIGRSLLVYGEFSPAEAALLRSLVRPGDRVVEVGANIGALTLPLLEAVGDAGQVVAFEPQPAVADLLERNVMAFGGRVQVRRCALGSAPGILYLPPIQYDRVGNFGGVGLQLSGTMPVQLMPLDDLDLPPFQLLKIDVEGMEQEVLLGAREAIRDCRPILYVEDDRPDRRRALRDLIRGLGYRIQEHNPALYAPTNHFRNPHNLFPGIVSMNLLCHPV